MQISVNQAILTDSLDELIEKLDDIQCHPKRLGVACADAEMSAYLQIRLEQRYPKAVYQWIKPEDGPMAFQDAKLDLLLLPFFCPEAWLFGETDLGEKALEWALFCVKSGLHAGGLLLLSVLSIESDLPTAMPKYILPHWIDGLHKMGYQHAAMDVDRIQYPEGKWVVAYAQAWRSDTLESYASPCDNEGTVFMPIDQIKPLA